MSFYRSKIDSTFSGGTQNLGQHNNKMISFHYVVPGTECNDQQPNPQSSSQTSSQSANAQPHHSQPSPPTQQQQPSKELTKMSSVARTSIIDAHRHIFIQHPTCPMPDCDLQIDSRNLRQHIANIHGNYTCDRPMEGRGPCQFGASDVYTLDRHRNNVHGDRREYTARPRHCRECDIWLRTVREYTKHRCEVHRGERMSRSTGPFDCPICDLKFQNKAALKSHQKRFDHWPPVIYVN
jgi:hypothetical protein